MKYKIVLFLVILVTLVHPCSSQTKRAMLVGVSTYTKKVTGPNDWKNIHGTNDVDLLSKTLKRQGFKVTSITNNNAKAGNIRKAFKSLIYTCNKGDVVYLHFSCHGQPVEDQNGDEKDGWDEAIVPLDAKMTFNQNGYKGENHIIDDELHTYIELIRQKITNTGMLYVVLDACHAGSSYRGEEDEDTIIIRGTTRGFSPQGKTYTPKIDKRTHIQVQRQPDASNVCILEACRSYQTNAEILQNGKYYGSLSWYVNKVLSNNRLETDDSWTNQVIKYMSGDIRLIKQNPVVESSK